MLKLLDSAGKKSKLAAAAKLRAESYNFFPGRICQFLYFSQYHGFMELAEISDVFQKLTTKLQFVLSVFKWNRAKKMNPVYETAFSRFLEKLVLLSRYSKLNYELNF